MWFGHHNADYMALNTVFGINLYMYIFFTYTSIYAAILIFMCVFRCIWSLFKTPSLYNWMPHQCGLVRYVYSTVTDKIILKPYVYVYVHVHVHVYVYVYAYVFVCVYVRVHVEKYRR